MAQAVIGALRVNLGLNSAQFRNGIRQANAGMQNFARNVRAGLMVAGVAAAGFAAGFARSMQTAIQSADEMYKAAQAAGTTVEALSQLRHAAEMSGSSFEGLQTGLRRLATAMEDVQNGSTGPASRAFERLGISVTDASGNLRAVDEVLSDVAQAFSQMEDGAQKSAAANAILGRSGTQLIPMLNAGANGLRSMRDEADRLGLTISTNTGQAAEAFNDNISRLKRAFVGIRNEVAAALLPVFERFSDALVTLMGDQELVRGISAGLVEVFKRIAIGALRVTKALYSMGAIAAWAASGFEGGAEGYEAALARVADAHRQIDGLIETISNDRIVTVRMELDGIGSPDAAAAWARRLRDEVTEPLSEIVPIITNTGQAITRDIGEPLNLIGPGFQNLATEAGAASQSIANSFGSVFQGITSSIGEAIKGTKSWRDVAIDALTSIANQLQSSIFQSLGNSFGGAGGFGGILSGLLGSFGGFFANGGTLGAGKWGIAGEAGPEIIRGPATIQPMGTGGTTINQSITVNGTIGAAEIARAIEQGNRSVLQQVPGVALNTVTNSNRRQPGLL